MTLKRCNSLLLVAILVVNAYIIFTPLLPKATYAIQSHSGKVETLTQAVSQPPTTDTNQPNHVVIPRMILDQPVLEGAMRQQYDVLDRGIWHLPTSSTPDKGGNTVLLGHRFTYTKPQGVFYLLDKLQPGDTIGLWWNNQRYTYRVTTIKEVLPTAGEIQDNTTDARLTLYTCTPLWLPKHRLVVIASLDQP